jgi:hypothetical protein
MMNTEQCFFFVIRTVGCFFFLDQTGSRVRVMNKHKHVDRLIVRTVKTLVLIPNLMRSKDLKHKRNKFLEKEAKN